MLQTVPRHHRLLPTCKVRIFNGVSINFCVFEDVWDLSISHCKTEVSVCALITHQSRAIGQVGVEDAGDAFDLVVIAIASRWEGLRMK